jgi:hypothetical protein
MTGCWSRILILPCWLRPRPNADAQVATDALASRSARYVTCDDLAGMYVLPLHQGIDQNRFQRQGEGTEVLLAGYRGRAFTTASAPLYRLLLCLIGWAFSAGL